LVKINLKNKKIMNDKKININKEFNDLSNPIPISIT
jgi:hypothetical protein